MNGKKLFFMAGKAGFVFCVALAGALTGCIGYVDRPEPRRVYVAPPARETVVVMQDDYVYYPGYEVYYSNSRRQYIYLEGRSWVARPAPPRVSVDVLFASPSVRLDFHDAPAHHHAALVRQYPRNWAPPGPNHGQDENRKDNQRDPREGNRGR